MTLIREPVRLIGSVYLYVSRCTRCGLTEKRFNGYASICKHCCIGGFLAPCGGGEHNWRQSDYTEQWACKRCGMLKPEEDDKA